jgi:hypothetical protein
MSADVRGFYAELPRCAWRGCVEPASWSLGYGRNGDELLFADYCNTHAADVGRLFRVEARAPFPDLAPSYAHPREALEAESAFVQGALVE